MSALCAGCLRPRDPGTGLRCTESVSAWLAVGLLGALIGISATGCAIAPETSPPMANASPSSSGSSGPPAPGPASSFVSTPRSTPSAALSLVPSDPVFEAMVGAIRAKNPTLRIRLHPDRLDGDWRLDGEVDDGLGPGRLFIDVTPKPGNITLNPCRDPDFVQGGRCIVRLLANGDRLALRGVVTANGTRTVVVALIHPDRTGITAEASNFTIGGVSTSITRRLPVYTVQELGRLVVALDQAVREVRSR